MKLTKQATHGQEVENSAPTPVNPTDIVRLQDIEYNISGAGTDKGNVLEIVNPKGGQTNLFSSNTAGAIKIKFPIDTTVVSQFSMQVRIFGERWSSTAPDSAIIFIRGKTKSLTSTDFSAVLLTAFENFDLPVRFGNDGTNYCIWIGELERIFKYVNIAISDVFIGRTTTGTYENWKGAFDISRVQAYGIVDVLLTNNLPLSKNSGLTATGTVLSLTKVAGTNYNYASASSATTYTTANPIVNGYASCLINAATEPTVTDATKITGATFVANTNMEMIVESKNGTSVRYFFLAL